MSISLKIAIVRGFLEKHGINPETIDLEAMIDSNLSLEDNLRFLSKELGIKR